MVSAALIVIFMTKIELISITNVLWPALQKFTQDGLNRSITKSLDAKNLPANTLSAYLAALGEFIQEDTDPVILLKEPGTLLNYISIGIGIITNERTFFDIISESELKILMTESFCNSIFIGITTATLSQYREGIINACSPITSYGVRVFFNQVLDLLDKLGFSKTFEHYSRRKHSDGTILLTNKQ